MNEYRLNYKEPKLWIKIIFSAVIIIIFAGFMTNPKSNGEEANEIIPEEISVYLDKINDVGDMYEEVTVKTKDNKKTFSWKSVTNPSYAPITGIADIDDDAKDEIVILLTTGYGTGVNMQEIHILKLEDLTELEIEDPIYAINKNIVSTIKVSEEKVNIKVIWDKKTLEKAYDKSYAGIWFEKVAFGSIVNYKIENNRIIARVPGAMSPSAFPVTAVLKYDKNLKVINIEVQENASYLETENDDELLNE